jgi:hypothetical protein
MDRVIPTMLGNDLGAPAKRYAPDAVAVTPESGRVRGRGNDDIIVWSKPVGSPGHCD